MEYNCLVLTDRLPSERKVILLVWNIRAPRTIFRQRYLPNARVLLIQILFPAILPHDDIVTVADALFTICSHPALLSQTLLSGFNS
jgi:hypothetical protein